LAGSICHLARSVCRRAERTLVSLGHNEYVNPETIRYVNRLSDFLFIVARSLNHEKGGKEIYWDSERLKHSI